MTRAASESLLFALLAALAYSLASILGGLTSRQEDPRLVFLVAQISGGLLLIPLVFLQGTRDIRTDLIWGAVAGLLATIGTVSNLRALSSGNMTVAAPVIGVCIVLVTVISDIALGNVLSVFRSIAVALGIASLVLMTPSGAARRPDGASDAIRSSSRRSVGYAILGGICLGLEVVALSRASTVTGFSVLLTLRVAAVVLLVPVVTSGFTRLPAPSKAWLAMAGIGLFFLLGDVGVVASTHFGALTISGMLVSLSPMITVFLAWVFLRESITRRQMIAIAIAFACIILAGLNR